jgi:hypothetical protein
MQLEDWDDENNNNNTKLTIVPDEAQMNYQEKISLLKSQLKSD